MLCDFAGFTTKPVKEVLKENVDMGGEKKRLGVKAFKIRILENSRANRPHARGINRRQFDRGMSASKPGQEAGREEDIGEAVPESNLTSDNPAKGFQLFKTDFDFFYSMDLL